MNGRRVSWEEFQEKVSALAYRIVDQYKPASITIVGVARGGWIVAALLSYELSHLFAIDAKVRSIGIKRYGDEGKPHELPTGADAELYEIPIVESVSPACLTLVVDEISATGVTLDKAVKVLGFAGAAWVQSAVLYTTDADFCDLFVEKIDSETWLYFPWDARKEDEHC
jgi:hypoxanthine phosphoribosyltransferase